MKQSFIIAMLMLGASVFAQTTATNKAAAQAETVEGLYVFISSKPLAENEYLGSISKSFALSGKPDEMLYSMIRKAKKEYPAATGIVFTSIYMDKADVVRFK